MSDKDKVLELTSKFILELSAQKPSNLLLAVRTHYDFWQSELVVLLRERNLPVNEYLAMLLRECGYENATSDKVRAYMSKVARSKQGSTKAVPLPALGVSSPVVMKAVEAPAAVARVQAVQGANGTAVVSEPMAVSKVVVSVPAAPGGFSFKTALDRLRSEPPGSAWSQEDDELHAAFLSLCSERNAGSIKNLTHYLKPNEQSKRDCFVQFLAKVDRTKKVI